MFHPDDLQPIDVREHIRRNQRLYFRGGAYHPVEAATLIAGEALLSGASDVRVVMSAGWVTVFANADWLDRVDGVVFERLLPFEPGGPNGFMAEILPVVFSRSLATSTSLGARIVKGDSLGPLSMPLEGWERAVSFELALERQVASRVSGKKGSTGNALVLGCFRMRAESRQ